jgi:hypothetical protein
VRERRGGEKVRDVVEGLMMDDVRVIVSQCRRIFLYRYPTVPLRMLHWQY